jgi:hypothetical protein
MVSTRKMKSTGKGVDIQGEVSSSSEDVELQQSITAEGWKFYLDEKMNIQNNKLEKLNVLDKLDKRIQSQNEKLDKLDKLDKISSDIAQMNVGVTSLMTYLRERNENPNSSRVNNVGNVQGSIVPVMGTVTRNIEVGQSSAENQNQTYNNERPASYPNPGLNMYRDEVRVEVPIGEPYFEQPQVEVNKETYTEDAFRTEFNRNAYQRNDGAYRPLREIENEVRRGRYNFHDNEEMEIIGIIEILGMIGMKGMIEMTGIGFKNHKGMSLRNQTKMLDKR